MLDKQNDKLLVISDKALDSGSFSYNWDSIRYDESDTTYRDSAMRLWLNNYFVQNAFTYSEQQLIVDTQLADVPDTATDKAFLLSKEEAETYFPDSESRRALNTDYSYPHYKLKMNRMGWGVDYMHQHADWVLRANNTDECTAWFVWDYSTIYWSPGDISRGGSTGIYMIRPAMWLRVSDN